MARNFGLKPRAQIRTMPTSGLSDGAFAALVLMATVAAMVLIGLML